MNILIIGAHPDDPESGCGGFSIRAVSDGNRVVFLYLASGIPGQVIEGRPACEIREEEARAACAICGAEPVFFRYPDGDVPCDRTAVKRLERYIKEIDADIVLTHWPVDTHPDHQAAGVMATQALNEIPDVLLAYYEVTPGVQTQCFEPNAYIDISDVAERKKRAVECHVSQRIYEWWRHHDEAELRRGAGIGVERAEAFCIRQHTVSPVRMPAVVWG